MYDILQSIPSQFPLGFQCLHSQPLLLQPLLQLSNLLFDLIVFRSRRRYPSHVLIATLHLDDLLQASLLSLLS